MEAIMRSLCEAEPDLERFTNQVVITDELREKFEVKFEVGDVEIDERYKNAYICKFYIEGREEYYICASIRNLVQRKSTFVFDVKKGSNEELKFFLDHGTENIRVDVIQRIPCKNQYQFDAIERKVVDSHKSNTNSLRRLAPSKNSKSTRGYNRYKDAKVYVLFSKSGAKIHIGSTIASLSENKNSHYMQSRNPKSLSHQIIFQGGFRSEITSMLLENYPCNSLAELTAREKFWKEAFPKHLQIGEGIERYQDISAFLEDLHPRLKKVLENTVINNETKQTYKKVIQVEETESDDRYLEAYIYKLHMQGKEEFYYGSSIKKPSDKRLLHINEAENSQPGKLYDFMRQNGVRNILLEVVEKYACRNEIQLRIKENEYIVKNLQEKFCLNRQIAIRSGTNEENRYKNGTIYAMFHDDCDQFYLGSTIQTLASRKGSHVAKAAKEEKCAFYKRAEEYGGVANFDIIVLERWPCNCKRQLEEREQFWKDLIPQSNLLNVNNALNTEGVRKEKRRIYNKALSSTEAFKTRAQERRDNETEEHRQVRLAKERAKPVTDERRLKKNEQSKIRRMNEDVKKREARLADLRAKNKERYARTRVEKLAKRMVVRMNAVGDKYNPEEASVTKYGIYTKADGTYGAKVLESASTT